MGIAYDPKFRRFYQEEYLGSPDLKVKVLIDPQAKIGMLEAELPSHLLNDYRHGRTEYQYGLCGDQWVAIEVLNYEGEITARLSGWDGVLYEGPLRRVCDLEREQAAKERWEASFWDFVEVK